MRIGANRLNRVHRFLRSLGLTVFICTPREHDAEMARTQAVAHFVLRGLQECGLKKSVFSTASHAKLVEALDLIQGDSQQLFTDMQERNSFAKKQRRRLIAALTRIDKELNRK